MQLLRISSVIELKYAIMRRCNQFRINTFATKFLFNDEQLPVFLMIISSLSNVVLTITIKLDIMVTGFRLFSI